MGVERGKILEKKTIYNLKELVPSGKQVVNLYTDLVKCQGCNTCTISCPQDLNVMGYIMLPVWLTKGRTFGAKLQ